MAVVVTGAAGHVGTHLVRALLAEGRPTRAMLHENMKALEGLELEVVEGDVCNLNSLMSVFRGAEVVYHLAAHISLLDDEWPLLESININGTKNVIQACLSCGVRRLIYFSTIHAISQEFNEVAVDESQPLVDFHLGRTYDHSKAAAEQEVRRCMEQGLDCIIISPTAIIGPLDYRPSYIGEALLRIAHGKFPTLIRGGFNWVDVRDVVEGAMRAEERAPAGSKYILGGHWVSVHDVAMQVEELTGVPSPGFVCPIWLARIGVPFITGFDRLTGKRPIYTNTTLRALSSHRKINYQKAVQELCYNPRPFRETVIDTLKWFEQMGMLKCSLRQIS